ncbi:hypothetical protein [Clostridium sp. HBUAS56017]|uniref:hypothetical protein n=1 Tax=Clostridium sp. HBUAS56017 TaxID=2571128 RepID=UPI0011783CA4|nr:hypothetical protein [Clostridium sp. HBUAS56017]
MERIIKEFKENEWIEPQKKGEYYRITLKHDLGNIPIVGVYNQEGETLFVKLKVNDKNVIIISDEKFTGKAVIL